MSYLVLARKYRPQTFSEVVGQEHVTRTLANAFRQDRVHHAFLFCGPRGVGKTTLARILGKALNCENGPTAEPCGTCAACTSIIDGSAVDYFEMDGASNRGIDSVRELTDAVRYQPAVLRKKVYVIDEVHMLTTEAFNALLKTLEEPPPHVTFVMATTEPQKVPNTVLSRCQRYDFKLVPTQRLSAHLEHIFAAEELPIEAGAIGLIVRESGGSVRDALSLADQVISYVGDTQITDVAVAEVLGVADRALTRTLVTSLADADAASALAAVEQAVCRGVDEVQISRAIVRFLRDIAAVQAAPEVAGVVQASEQERAELEALAAAHDPSRITQMFDRMIRCADELSRLPQPRLVLDLALIDVAGIEPLVPLGDLLERLADLERRIASGGASGAQQGSPRARRQDTTGAATQRRQSQARPAVVSQRAASPETAKPTTPSAVQGSARPEQAVSISTPAVAPVSASAPAPVSASAPAPVSASAPAPASAGPDSERAMLARWEEVICALGAESARLPLVGLYENAKVLLWTADTIRVGFARGSFDGESACETAKIEDMRVFLNQYFGRPIAFSAELLNVEQIASSPNARSAIDFKREEAEKVRAEREAEARQHPLTNRVLETFGATIKEIKTDV